jgi:hypothetical protein
LRPVAGHCGPATVCKFPCGRFILMVKTSALLSAVHAAGWSSASSSVNALGVVIRLPLSCRSARYTPLWIAVSSECNPIPIGRHARFWSMQNPDQLVKRLLFSGGSPVRLSIRDCQKLQVFDLELAGSGTEAMIGPSGDQVQSSIENGNDIAVVAGPPFRARLSMLNSYLSAIRRVQRMKKALSIVTSSQQISSSPIGAKPRFWTSDWRS